MNSARISLCSAGALAVDDFWMVLPPEPSEIVVVSVTVSGAIIGLRETSRMITASAPFSRARASILALRDEADTN